MHLVVDLLVELADSLYGPSCPQISHCIVELGAESQRCRRHFDDRGGPLGWKGRDECKNWSQRSWRQGLKFQVLLTRLSRLRWGRAIRLSLWQECWGLFNLHLRTRVQQLFLQGIQFFLPLQSCSYLHLNWVGYHLRHNLFTLIGNFCLGPFSILLRDRGLLSKTRHWW